jgi:hypothetical protein
VGDDAGLATQRDHAGLHAHGLALGAVEVVGAPEGRCLDFKNIFR